MGKGAWWVNLPPPPRILLIQPFIWNRLTSLEMLCAHFCFCAAATVVETRCELLNWTLQPKSSASFPSGQQPHLANWAVFLRCQRKELPGPSPILLLLRLLFCFRQPLLEGWKQQQSFCAYLGSPCPVCEKKRKHSLQLTCWELQFCASTQIMPIQDGN